jgi:hypothetical protein
MTQIAAQSNRYVICVSYRGNSGSVLKGKVYRVVAPHKNDLPSDVRIIDEENEDYPYPREWFAEIDLPAPVLQALDAA